MKYQAFARTVFSTALACVLAMGSSQALASNKPWVPVVDFGDQLVKVIGTFSTVNAKGEKEDREFNCTGLLVSPTKVISASHCFYHRKLDTLEVFDTKNVKQDAAIASIKLGKGFDGYAAPKEHVEGKKNLGYQIGDVASFDLVAPFPKSLPAHAIRLAKTMDEARALTFSKNCVSAGYGHPENVPGATEWTTTLDVAKKLVAHGFKTTNNNSIPEAHGYVIANDLVLSTPRQLTHGDSGGPLICKNELGERVLVGVNSSYSTVYYEATTPDGMGQAVDNNYFVLVSEESLLSE